MQKQEEEKQEEDRERQARQEEERKRIGRDIDITLNAYFDGMRFHNIESNYGVYESRFYHQLKSQLITIPKGKIWVFKGFDIDGRVEEAIVGKSDGDGFISSTDRYDLKIMRLLLLWAVHPFEYCWLFIQDHNKLLPYAILKKRTWMIFKKILTK